MNPKLVHLLRRALAAISFTLVLFGPAVPAHASNDGKLCEPFGNLFFCMLAIGMVALFPAPEDWLLKDVKNGDADAFRRDWTSLVPPEPTSWLQRAVDIHLHPPAATREALGSSAEAGQRAIIEFLLAEGAGLSDGANTRLFKSVAENRVNPRSLKVLELLLAHGASSRDVDLERFMSLNDGKRDGAHDVQVLELLLANGADPGIRTPTGKHAKTSWPLMTAIQSRRYDLAERLLQHGADPNATPAPGSPGLLVQLVRQCPSSRPSHESGSAVESSARQSRCQFESAEKVSYLVEHGADVNGRASAASGCFTPHEAALREKNYPAAAALSAHGADPAFFARCIDESDRANRNSMK